MTNELRAYIREMISVLNDDAVFKVRQNFDLVDNTENDGIVLQGNKDPGALRHDLYEIINGLISAYDNLGDDYEDPEIEQILSNLKKETSNLATRAE